MKIQKLHYGLSALCCILSAACTTHVVDNEPSQSDGDDGKSMKLNFRIMQNNYTRAYDATKENDISSLILAFYKIEESGNSKSSLTYLYSLTAEQGTNSGEYTAKINPVMDLPNAVVAFANLPEGYSLSDALNNPALTVDDLQNGDLHVMSSARYYDTDNNNADVYYSPITSSNIGGIPIEIYLERVGAKVTVSSEGASLAPASVADKDNGNRELSLSLKNWEIIATDKSTYLLKNNNGISHSEMSGLLNRENPSEWIWNKPSTHTLSWAMSVNYDKKADSYPLPGSESAESFIKFLDFENVQNEYGSSAIYHETTRPAELFETRNGRPTVVLTGQYKITGSQAQTLYRRGNVFITHDELCQIIADANKNNVIFNMYDNWESGNKVTKITKEHVKNLFDNDEFYFESVSGELANTVSLRIKSGLSQRLLCPENDDYPLSENEIQEIETKLAAVVGEWEIYEDGYCFFTVPIEHAGKQYDAAGTLTGSYGLVRNHHYKINVKNISGIGHGVKKGALLGDWPDEDKWNVSCNVNVNPWTDVNQEINIP